MTKKFKALQIKRQYISNKTVVGIDPAKEKHQAVILNDHGIQLCPPFTFRNNHHGYTNFIKKVKQFAPQINDNDLVFAIETSCNLWSVLSHFIHSQGYQVLLVSPLTTKNSRPMLNHDFSRTDPKDAILMASNARQGYFDFYKNFNDEQKAMHALSIAYDKLLKNYVQQRNRIRSLLERYFPEFFRILNLDTHTAQYLLSKYFLPVHFLNIDIANEVPIIESISHKNHGQPTLESLQKLAENSIGIPLEDVEEKAERMILDTWLLLLKQVEDQMQLVCSDMIKLAQKTPYFKILTSIKGISDKMAALFIAETRDLSLFNHYKQIETYAGYNLRQSQSGNYIGPRHINHIGNRRLSWLLYRMTEEAAKYVPEVRVKFLKRQLQKRQYRKNIVAASPNLLKLLFALIRDQRGYEYLDNGFFERLLPLEKKYKQLKEMDKRRFKSA